MKLYCCTFASKKFIKKQINQKKYILNSGFEEKEIFSCNTSILDEPYLKRINKVVDKLNNGECVGFSFKPYFLSLILNRIKNGDIIMYIDVNDKPKKGIKEYIKKKFTANPKLGIIATGTNYPNIKHLSSFHKENLSLELIMSSNLFAQPEAGVLVIKNSETTKALINTWYEMTLINYLQTNNSTSPKDRFDQETLFTLSRIYKIIKIESWLFYKLTGKGLRRFIDFEYLRFNSN